MFGGTFFLTTQETHHTTYIASHIVGHDAPDSHRENWVMPSPKDSLFYTKIYRRNRIGLLDVFLLPILLYGAAISYPTWNIIVYHY